MVLIGVYSDDRIPLVFFISIIFVKVASLHVIMQTKSLYFAKAIYLMFLICIGVCSINIDYIMAFSISAVV